MSDESLRDELALSRTVLANERTLLAYVRTALAFLLAGATLLHFFTETRIVVVGGCLLLVGIVLNVIAVWRFLYMRKRLAGFRS